MKTNILAKLTAVLTVILASAAFAADSPTLICGLTGKEVKECCCQQNEGKLVCKHTGKVLEKCCCTTKK
ncbi:MAG TPA: hypothetical protein VK993_00885 [Chthoniobacterales bacterium]|nr:hypothetical protein [Chthoniobacterales bacterium]